MVPKSTKGKGGAKDVGATEPPESALAVQRTQSAFFPSTVDVDAETLAQRVKRDKTSAGGQPPAVDQEDIDAIIEDVAKDAAVEAEKVAAEESAKGAAEGAAKGPAEESGKATAEEARKGPAGDSGKAAAEEKAQETAAGLAALAEAARTQHQAALNSQEEDLAKHEADLDAKLCAKDREVEKLVRQRTQELEQRHREVLDAQALVHAGKGAAVNKAGELSEANNSIKDLKRKLEGLEGMLREAKAWEGTLANELETEKQLRKERGRRAQGFRGGREPLDRPS
nr:translation initiation factor IF-2-like [Aegilops tauschii subsp. strangulata]